MIGRDSTRVIHNALVRPGTPLADLVENRVWARNPPSVTVWQNDQPAIVFQIMRDSVAGLGQISMRCYGGSNLDADARAVYRALVSSMHGTYHPTSIGTLVYMFHDSCTPDLVEPDSGYPVVVANFNFCVM